jgi:hypothetical protein
MLWNGRTAETFEKQRYRYLGEEVISGTHALHYAILSSWPEMFGPIRKDASDVRTEVWIANEESLPSFVARIAITWRITSKGEEGEGEYIFEIYDANEPFSIEPPEGAPAAVP